MAEPGEQRRGRAGAVDRLTAAMDELSALPVEAAATKANLAEIAVLERVRSWGPAQQSRVLAALEVAEPRDYDPDSSCTPSPGATTPHEIALLLRVSTAAARGRLDLARSLVADFPATLAAATDGTLPWWHARRAVEDTAELSPAARAAVDLNLAAHANKGGSPARFAGRLAAAILAADPAAAEKAHVHALADRAVWVDPRPDGTVAVAATMAADDGGAFLEMVDRLRDTPLSVPPAGWPTDGRTADQRRSDGLTGLSHAVLAGLDATALGLTPDAAAQQVLAGLLTQAAATGAGAAAGGAPRAGRRLRRPGQVLVTVSAETLLGISDTPAHLDGHGPITAGHARRLAGSGDTTWRRLLTDPTSGAVLDIGRTRYTPTTAIADHVLTRSNRQCTRPGCPRPAAHLDHAQPWSDQGATSTGNLTGLCQGDHRARHTGWTIRVRRDGATAITTTHGITTTTAPHDHRPADRSSPQPPTRETAPPPPGSAEPTSTLPAALRPQPFPRKRPVTALDRIRALFPTADHTTFPTPEPSGVGDPDTGQGWLTQMHGYIATTHDRACANQPAPTTEPPTSGPPRPEPPRARREGPDDPPPF